MATAIYENLTEKEKNEVRMFGVTEAGMREAVSYRLRTTDAPRLAISIMSDAQEMLEYSPEDVRQALNRAKWILMEFEETRN
jgi:hypothetical protein